MVKYLTEADSEEIVEFISSLDKIEDRDVIRDIATMLILENATKYTETRNGLYIKFTDLSAETLAKLVQFVNFQLHNRLELKQRVEEMEAQSKTLSKRDEIPQEIPAAAKAVEESAQVDVIESGKTKRVHTGKSWGQLIKECKNSSSMRPTLNQAAAPGAAEAPEEAPEVAPEATAPVVEEPVAAKPKKTRAPRKKKGAGDSTTPSVS